MAVRKVVVGLLSDAQEFQRMQAADARDSARRLGLQVEVLFAEDNAVLQIQQLFRFVHAEEGARPVAIVTETVTGEGLERVARNAVQEGIGWVLINRRVGYLDGLRSQRPDLPIAMVSSDQEEIGRIQARQFLALLPKGGTVLYIQGPADTSAAQERLRGAAEGLRGAGIELKVVSGDWTEAGGERAVSSWMRLKTSEGARVALVGSQNDAMAVGARNWALAKRPDWGQMRFTGVDGLAEGGRRLVDQGALAATVVAPSGTGPALERISEWLRTGRVPPRDVLLEPRSYPSEASIRP